MAKMCNRPPKNKYFTVLHCNRPPPRWNFPMGTDGAGAGAGGAGAGAGGAGWGEGEVREFLTTHRKAS